MPTMLKPPTPSFQCSIYTKGGITGRCIKPLYVLGKAAIYTVENIVSPPPPDDSPEKELGYLKTAGLYSSLFLGNSVAECLKTRKQRGLEPSYGESLKAVVAGHGKPLKPAAIQMGLRLLCRSGVTMAAVSNGQSPSAELLAAIETTIFTPPENYRMQTAHLQNPTSLNKWAHGISLADAYKGAWVVGLRQWAQWRCTYGIRDTVKEHTSLNHDQATFVGVTVSTIPTTAIDVVRNIIQEPKNKDSTLKEIAIVIKDTLTSRNALRGVCARIPATQLNLVLSLHVMDKVGKCWTDVVAGNSGTSSPQR